MATLAELRAKVRSQTQTKDSVLTDDEIDSWLQEAFDRTIGAINQWPFYEETWSLTLLAGQSTIALPTSPALEPQGIVSIMDVTDNVKLAMVDHEWAEDWYGVSPASAGTLTHFSVWDDTINFWPALDLGTNHAIQVRGYRQPNDWIADGASAQPDCDSRLHLGLANYAIALAYIQQEDESLERVYMERWQKDVEIAFRAITDPGRNRPLTMGPRYITPIGRGLFR